MRLAEAIAPHRLTTRQIDRLYQHYVGGPEVTRELVLTDPLLVLRLTDETTPARVRPDASPPEALITDFHVLGAVTRRAHRRLQHGGGLLPPERARAWRVFDQVQTRIRNLTFTPLKFVIEGPVAASLHPLEEEDSRKTKPIEFKVKSDAQTGVVTWSASREYTTRGGITATPNPVVQSFQTQPGASEIRTYEGEGGEVTVTATSTVNGAQLIAGPSKFYVVGVQIPDPVISARLIGPYSGATPGLLKGIAFVESTYRQFEPFKHPKYGVQSLWPVENYATLRAPRGKYIGLMMTPFTTATAWDWYENTIQGLLVFQEHLRIARVVEDRIRAKYPQLPALTGEQRENMALAAYSGNVQPLTDETRQYYIPSADGRRWEDNPRQQGGIDYATKVRNGINQR